MPIASPNLSQLIPVSPLVMLTPSLGLLATRSHPQTPLTGQMVLNPHLIWPFIPFVCLIFCHCPEAKSSLGQRSCLVFGTVSFPGHLYAHL